MGKVENTLFAQDIQDMWDQIVNVQEKVNFRSIKLTSGQFSSLPVKLKFPWSYYYFRFAELIQMTFCTTNKSGKISVMTLIDQLMLLWVIDMMSPKPLI